MTDGRRWMVDDFGTVWRTAKGLEWRTAAKTGQDQKLQDHVNNNFVAIIAIIAIAGTYGFILLQVLQLQVFTGLWGFFRLRWGWTALQKATKIRR